MPSELDIQFDEMLGRLTGPSGQMVIATNDQGRAIVGNFPATVPELLRTRDEVIAYCENWFTAFPDLRVHTTNRVVGEDYAHGISAWMIVPAPGALVTAMRPPIAATRSSRPRRPEPRAGSAPPTPSSAISTARRPSCRSIVSRTLVAFAYLATFVSASAAT